MPSSRTTLLTKALVGKLKTTDDLRYHLSWTYGGFIEDIPRHLGINEALDASVDALVSTHSSLGSHARGFTSSESLAKYSYALSAMRLYLDDPKKARTVETLCAVMVLLICQSFIGGGDGLYSGHGEGAAQILKARQYYDPHDEFESKLVLSLRGPVLFEALWNPKISFTPKEWKRIVENGLDGATYEGQMMRCLAYAPDFLKRGRDALQNKSDLELLRGEVTQQYLELKGILSEAHERFNGYLKSPESGSGSSKSVTIRTMMHCWYQRSYGLGLAICLMFNCMMKALYPNDFDLEVESVDYCRQVLELTEQAALYRPLAAAWVSICLIAAWCARSDEEIRGPVEVALADYLSDFPSASRGLGETWRRELEHTARRFSLLEI